MLSLHRIPNRRWGCYASLLVAFVATTPLYAAELGFTTIFSADMQDYASCVTSDSAGNTYVAGLTYSPRFPVTPGVVQTTWGGAKDAFVAKLGPDGKVIWATYLGGMYDDQATGIKVDSGGNVIVTGQTISPDFPVSHAVRPTITDGTTYALAFLTKLDPTGTHLIYSTYIDPSRGLALDAAGNAYVAGLSSVTKFTPEGALAYSFRHAYTFYTNVEDHVAEGGIAVDSAGAAYVAGTGPRGGDHMLGSDPRSCRTSVPPKSTSRRPPIV